VTALLVLQFGFPLKLGADEVAARGQISQALSTVFALVMGLIAVLVALRVESASYKASQEVRVWLARVTSLLLAMMRFSAFESSGGSKIPNYSDFTKAVRELHISQTGLAITSWISSIEPDIKGELRPKGWRVFMLDLCRLESETAARSVGMICSEVLNVLATLKPSDIRSIASRVQDLDRALGSLPVVIEGDIIIRVMLSQLREKDPDENAKIFRYIQSKGVVDPDVDLFIAVTSEFNNVDDTKRALGAGANPNVTQGEVLSRYKDLVAEYRSKRPDE
jgi:hypothetical protein